MGYFGACLRAGVTLGVIGAPSVASAQTQGLPVCVPGTTVCAESDGRGGVQINASGRAQASPSGANASGQAGANANANANANGSGQADSSGGGSYYQQQGYGGRYGSAATLCAIGRVGIWSGFKAGGCLAFSFRWEALTFEMETQLLYGGTTHAFDWTFPLSFLIPLANDDSLFEGGYLRFGGSPIGVTFARAEDGGNFIRFGLFAGGGFELELGDAATWRVFDARLSFDMGTRRAMDRLDNWVDLGLQVGTGLVF
jgi:hypothetical protein